MKILYAVQGTGNGHISRAIELLPYIEQQGKVDIFLSGLNNQLSTELSCRYKSNGINLFYTATGSISYANTLKNFSPGRVIRDYTALPVKDYDLIINDFEAITSLACKRKNVPFVHFGHQASFKSAKVPRPVKRDKIGELVLRNYARSPQTVGLHFNRYDSFILPPVIRSAIYHAKPVEEEHITVYLPQFEVSRIMKTLHQCKEFNFHVFVPGSGEALQMGNCLFIPVSKESFTASLISCIGIITSSGFETPAEALYLKKKILTIPIENHYEQLCNAEALRQMDVTVTYTMDDSFPAIVREWINTSAVQGNLEFLSTAMIVKEFFQRAACGVYN